MASSLPIIHTRWQHSFDGLKFSSMDFFNLVEESISKRQMTEVSFKRINLHEKGMFSSKREYLRITRNEYAYDISAAPFGTGFFVSYRFGQKLGFWKLFLFSFPLLGRWYAKSLRNKTYFELDTENMFNGSVHSAFMEAIDTISNTKGVRGLTELEKIPIELRKLK